MVDRARRVEDVRHHDEMHLAYPLAVAMRQHEAVGAHESRQQRVRLALHVHHILRQDVDERTQLAMRNRLDQIPPVIRKVEEGATFALREEFGQRSDRAEEELAEDLLGPEGEHVDRVGDPEELTNPSEGERRVVLEVHRRVLSASVPWDLLVPHVAVVLVAEREAAAAAAIGRACGRLAKGGGGGGRSGGSGGGGSGGSGFLLPT